jgi:hypothetical protein
MLLSPFSRTRTVIIVVGKADGAAFLRAPIGFCRFTIS